ncbi:MAG: hypothetical protein IJJ06_09430 [Mogibacterium sp.]|nr:hypothetical protein [Mogibacterium sp.]
MEKKTVLKKIAKKAAAILLVACFFVNIPFAALQFTDASGEVKMGQAKRGENGVKGNKPGDKSGREVLISDWSYSVFPRASEHWSYVIRAKDPDVGRRLAENMKKGCLNDHIGYDQNYPDRGTLYNEAKKVGWDLSKVEKNCETTCTCIIAVCLNAEGIKAPRYWMSGDVKDDLEATGKFYIFDSEKYTTSSSRLAVGDILVNPGKHTAVVVESPHPFTYPVKYTKTTGKTGTAQVAEKAEMTLNLNNGEDPVIVTADKELDLSEYEPEKNEFRFIGWERTGASSFSARYEGKSAAIVVNSDPVNISDQD